MTGRTKHKTPKRRTRKNEPERNNLRKEDPEEKKSHNKARTSKEPKNPLVKPEKKGRMKTKTEQVKKEVERNNHKERVRRKEEERRVVPGRREEERKVDPGRKNGKSRKKGR